MNLPAIYYSAELDVFVVVRAPAIDIETGELCTPIEWEWMDMAAAQVIYGRECECEPFKRGNFEYIGEL